MTTCWCSEAAQGIMEPGEGPRGLQTPWRKSSPEPPGKKVQLLTSEIYFGQLCMESGREQINSLHHNDGCTDASMSPFPNGAQNVEEKYLHWNIKAH